MLYNTSTMFVLVLCCSVLLCRIFFFFFSSRRRHTRSDRDWSSDVCSSDLPCFSASDMLSPLGRRYSMGNPLAELAKVGQSVWYDQMERRLVASGALQRMIDRKRVV